MRMSAMIKIENVSKVYGKGKKNQVQALKSIDLELEQGHNYAIIGKSGSGKSTLMNMIGLLDLPTEGKIFFKGSDISHRKIMQIFFCCRNALLPGMICPCHMRKALQMMIKELSKYARVQKNIKSVWYSRRLQKVISNRRTQPLLSINQAIY